MQIPRPDPRPTKLKHLGAEHSDYVLTSLLYDSNALQHVRTNEDTAFLSLK